MQTLLIEVEGRVLRFDAPRLIRIGRSIDADVVLSAGSVSRAHAELRPVEGSWVLVDAGSQYGTFVGGHRVRELPVDGPTTVQCGPPAPGSSLTITPQSAAQAPPPTPGQDPASPPAPGSDPAGCAPPAPPPDPAPTPASGIPTVPPDALGARGAPPPGAGGGYDETFVLAAPSPGPQGGYLGPPRTGPDLLVVAEGREHRFRHPAQLSVGRLPDCDIVLDDPVASRMHGQIHPVPGGWTYVNMSQEGSFLDGRRIDRQGFEEPLRLRLGHPVAGPELALVPILSAAEEERRFARRRRRRILGRLGVALAVVVVVVGTVLTAVLVTGNDDDSPSGTGGTETMSVLTEDELDSAKSATVRLLGTSTDSLTGAPVEYTGSGSIISEDGLILTNAHVAAPEAPGLQEQYGAIGIEDPEYLLVALTEGAGDTPSAPAYRARLVEADGALDAAVIQVYADEDGDELDPGELDLPAMPLGDSDELRTGDPVTVLGFPGISTSGAVTVTTGVISTFVDSEDLGPRSEIDTDARIAPGNSGGAAINNDAEIIGIPSAFFRDGEVPIVSGRIRPINVVMDLIESAGGGR